MKHCKNCKFGIIKDNKDYCKKKKMYVSYNANWCNSYKTPLLNRIKQSLKRKLWD